MRREAMMWGQFCAVALIAASSLTMCGCSDSNKWCLSIPWVTKKQSLDTSFALGATAERGVPARPVPMYERTIPPGGLILPPLHEEDEGTFETDVSFRHERDRYLRGVHNDMREMYSDVLRLASNADQKGAAGWAAFDPKLRAITMNAKLIQRYLLQIPDADEMDWETLKVKIDAQLQEARAVLLEAQQDINRVDNEAHVVSSTDLSDHPLVTYLFSSVWDEVE
jgi:hypothetical protein